MFDDHSVRLYNSIQRNKWLVAVLAAAIIIAAVIGLKSVNFDNNIELMLPGNDEVYRSIRFLRESNLSDKVILSFGLKSSEYTTKDLIAGVKKLKESLGPPLVTDVISGISENNVVEEMLELLKYAPQLIDERNLLLIEKQINPSGVKESLQNNYRQFLTPASTLIIPFIRSDPLGIYSNILRSLQKIYSSVGYEVTVENDYFISKDRKHAMLILDTPVNLTDGFGSRKLISYLNNRLTILPDFISADIIAGHLHTVSNEEVIKRDIRLTLIIASAAFILLFIVIFKDLGAIIIFLIPLASVIVSINISNLILNKLSYFIVGMGAVIAGIAVDYGIHVYTAVRIGDSGQAAVNSIAKPLIIGALTTISVFASFFFSSVQGYHQLAFFSILSIILCLACSLFILPHFIMKGKYNKLAPTVKKYGKYVNQRPLKEPKTKDKCIVLCWGIFMIIALIQSKQISFNSEISQFDGSEIEIIKAEQKFHSIWVNKTNPAVFVVQGNRLEEALKVNEKIYKEAKTVVGEDHFSSLAAIWPSKQTRKANVDRWKEFWKQGKEEKLRELISTYGSDYNFSEDAFSPFFDNLYACTIVEDEPESIKIYKRLKERFVIDKNNRLQVMSFFPDEDKYVNAMSTISSHYPGTFLVSRKVLSRMLSKSVSSEIILLSGIAAIMIPLLTCLLLKDIRMTSLALVPVITGITAVMGMIQVFGLSLNAPTLIAAMVVLGLCIDYGIFMVYTCRRNLKTGTRMAVSLSAITTLIGAGVLLFANHPVLFSIGATIVSGVLFGYIASMIVIPSFYRLWLKNTN